MNVTEQIIDMTMNMLSREAPSNSGILYELALVKLTQLHYNPSNFSIYSRGGKNQKERWKQNKYYMLKNTSTVFIQILANSHINFSDCQNDYKDNRSVWFCVAK